MMYALRKGLVDYPGARSSHDNITPRGGGISIVIVFLFIAALLTLLEIVLDIKANIIWSVVIGGSIVAIIGFIDDHKHIAPGWRIVVHSIAACFSLAMIYSLPEIHIFNFVLKNVYILFPIYAVGVIWLLNLFNFMDGIDGIASVEAITVSISAAIIMIVGKQYDLAYILLLLSASVAGFLVWNWPPAKVFMGDACSGFLGMVLGLFAVITSQTDAINIWTWLILLSVFVVDASYTLIRRIMNNEEWYKAHRSHAYQILSRQHKSHKKISVTVLLINVFWLFPLAYLSVARHDWAPILSIIAMLPLLVIVHWVKAGTRNS